MAEFSYKWRWTTKINTIGYEYLYDSSVSVMNMSYLFKLWPPQNKNERRFTMHVFNLCERTVKKHAKRNLFTAGTSEKIILFRIF